MLTDDLLPFGRYTWRVLALSGDRALLITEDILELRWYHSRFVNVTWAECNVRHYLNSDFYQEFRPDEQARISPVTNKNPANPWFRTAGGEDTEDTVFLLSLEEVCTYFGNSSLPLRHKNGQTWLIDDENNRNRQAAYQADFHWWRLRSPGYYGRTSASVSRRGHVYVRGNGVYGRPRDGGGVRPALWLRRTEAA